MSKLADPSSAIAQATTGCSLPAHLHPQVHALLTEHAALIHTLTHGLGSPLHLLLPEIFAQTVREFQSAITQAQVAGLIMFAKKANKGRCFVQQCAALNIGVDTASAAELQQALAAGIPGQHIGVSGPSKQIELIDLALRHQALIAIDSIDELHRIAQRRAQIQQPARILLRCRPDQQQQHNSRFGLNDSERIAALNVCLAQQNDIKLEGFSFHLNAYSARQRAAMADQLIDWCVAARQQGLTTCNTVNIGGGFAVRYTDSAAWGHFLQHQRTQDYHAEKSFDSFYPYGSINPSGAAMLTEILNSATGQGITLREKITKNDIRLLLEPGRALLDQAGVSIFRVQGVKDRHASEGYAIITVEGMSFSLSEQWFNSEYLPEPRLLSLTREGKEGSFKACVGGASCLESDMLNWRKIPFPHAVKVGDLLLYPNTAGYQMDANESAFHDTPLPRKAVITLHNGQARWRLDEVANWQ